MFSDSHNEGGKSSKVLESYVIIHKSSNRFANHSHLKYIFALYVAMHDMGMCIYHHLAQLYGKCKQFNIDFFSIIIAYFLLHFFLCVCTCPWRGGTHACGGERQTSGAIFSHSLLGFLVIVDFETVLPSTW